MSNYANERFTKERDHNLKLKKQIKSLQFDLNQAHELNSALTVTNQEQDKIIKDLLARYEKECYNVIEVNGNVVGIYELPSYRTYLPLQEIEGYDMNKIKRYIETPLYQKNQALQFVYKQGNQLRIDKTKYNKFISLL